MVLLWRVLSLVAVLLFAVLHVRAQTTGCSAVLNNQEWTFVSTHTKSLLTLLSLTIYQASMNAMLFYNSSEVSHLIVLLILFRTRHMLCFFAHVLIHFSVITITQTLTPPEWDGIGDQCLSLLQ